MNKLPLEIQSYFSEIAERLWSGHASVMVGAGFSKNAINTVDQYKMPPDWGQLGDKFYEKLYNTKTNDKVKYLSLLKLAEEYEAAFGRSALDNFISKNIADNEFEPSLIHQMLMELPWSDVFTTNYDTLLERSCKDVLSRRYDVVINQNDLIYSNKPRIIKLHGSLPSERPFIITEEDYRIYPKRFAPFINTVQQSLLENTLCLIGFSGDDPNFLKWVGWINDNLGKENSPKIYLVGVLSLSESQKKLLQNKNIITVDLSNCNGINGNHKLGLELFITYLSEQRIKRENLEWPRNIPHPAVNECFKSKIKEWKICREKFPNWIIVPQEQRDLLWQQTEEHISEISVFNTLNSFEVLNYAYELNWRLEKCLIPILNNIAPYFQKILDNYMFSREGLFKLKKNDENIDENNINWREYKNYWIHLSLSLLRFYREEGYDNEWIEMYNRIYSIKRFLSNDEIANFYYEQVLNSIFKLKYIEAKKLLEDWPQNNASVFWNVKRAMLLSEFGFSKEASNLLELSLLDIRRKLNLSPIEDNYSWVSQESYVMFQLMIIRHKLRLNNSKDDFSERWNDLLQYKCDPWGEKKYFDIMLQQKEYKQEAITIKRQFGIGQTTKVYNLENTSKDTILGYNFLRYLEELALPLGSFNNKTVIGAIKKIKTTSSQWVINILHQYEDREAVNVIFDREQLLGMSVSIIDKYIKEYLSLFNSLLTETDLNSITKAFINNIPDILSRLCTKCSDTLKIELFLMYQNLSKKELVLPNLDKLLKNLIDSSDKDILRKGAEILIDTPIYDSKWRISYDFKEPFNYFKADSIKSKLTINEESLDILFNKAKYDVGIRENALKRLMFLFMTKSFNEDQAKHLFDILWNQTDINNGLPINTNFYYFAFIAWPLPNGVNAEDLYKKYIKQNNFSIQTNSSKKGISFQNGEDRYAEEILYGSQTENKKDGVIWTLKELDEILTKCEEWWNLDMHYLADDKNRIEGLGGSIYKEFLSRFHNLSMILFKVYGYRKDLTLEIKKRIKVLTIQMENSGIAVLSVKIAFELYKNPKDYLKELKHGLTRKDRMYVLDGFESVILVLSNNVYRNKSGFVKQTLEILYAPLEWHILGLIGDVFEVITCLLKYYNWGLNLINDRVYASLQYIFEFENNSDEMLLNDYLLLKRQSISLASIIYKKTIDDNLAIPEIIIKWKEVAENENEFADIRNRW